MESRVEMNIMDTVNRIKEIKEKIDQARENLSAINYSGKYLDDKEVMCVFRCQDEVEEFYRIVLDKEVWKKVLELLKNEYTKIINKLEEELMQEIDRLRGKE